MVVRFTSHCRDGLSWKKNDIGEVVQTLATKPNATSDIYIVQTNNKGLVWATSEDVEEWNQLTLF